MVVNPLEQLDSISMAESSMNYLILVVASQLLNYLLPGSSYSRLTREPKLRYHAKIQAYNH